MADTPDRLETLANVRALYPAYKDTPDLELGNGLAAKYPQAYGFLKTEVPRGEGDKATRPTTPESIAGSVLNPGQPNPLTMLQRVGNAVLPPLATAPAIAAGGELLPAAPAIGRALTSGALGGAKAASEGKGPGGIVWDTVVDTLLGVVTEAAGKVAGAVKIPKLGWTSSLSEKAGKVAGAAAGRERGGNALDAARDLIEDRIPPKARFMIPAINPKTPLSLQDAVAGLKKLDDPQYTMAKDQLVAALNDAERAMFKQGVRIPGGPPVVKPFAGSVFGKSAPQERFTYRGTGPELALGRASALVPGAMAGSQSEATTETVPGVPNALLPLLGLTEGSTFGELARHARPRL